jgi:hypothetical protein
MDLTFFGTAAAVARAVHSIAAAGAGNRLGRSTNTGEAVVQAPWRNLTTARRADGLWQLHHNGDVFAEGPGRVAVYLNPTDAPRCPSDITRRDALGQRRTVHRLPKPRWEALDRADRDNGNLTASPNPCLRFTGEGGATGRG